MQRFRLILMAGTVLAFAAAGFTLQPDDRAAATVASTAAATTEAPTVALEGGPEIVPGAAGAAVAAEAARATPEADAAARAPALETITGSASYYADMFEGRTTASGVPFRQAEMWAAHKTLPFGTQLRVTNLANGNEVEVEVVDRGPYAHGRVLDLSKSAARKLGFIRAGHTRVKIEVIRTAPGP